MSFSNRNRKQVCQSMSDEMFDVFVIGGGITGAGIALDASSRGMKVAMVDMQDFSAGASSRSTKLVHGGFRYLEQKEFKLVAEVGREREIIHQNSPHLTKPVMMLQPYYKSGPNQALSTKLKLKLYDTLAGVKKGQRHQILSKKETLQLEPLLQAKKLRGAGYYQEYKTDDARLTIEVVKKACQLGARALNYLKVIGLLYDGSGTTNGVELEDQITGECYQVFAKKIVNATGAWVDTIRSLEKKKYNKDLALTKGIHLVFDRATFPLTQAVYFTNSDDRMIFALPHGDKSYVGSTDTPYDGNLTNPKVTTEDKTYLIDAIATVFPDLELDPTKIESSWAGLRPYIGIGDQEPNERSRKEQVFVEDSGLISITGGKLTAYRKMAETIVDLIAKQLKQEKDILYSKSDTKLIPIAGGEVEGVNGFEQFKQHQLTSTSDLPLAEHIKSQYIDRYGTNVRSIWQNIRTGEAKASYYNIELPVYAELCYALENECIYKPLDFFIRRTGAMLFDQELVKENIAGVLAYLKEELCWDKEEAAYYGRECSQLLVEHNK